VNSSVSFDSSSGLTSWVVDTIPQLKLQWFYYRLDGMTQEMALGAGSLGFVKAKASDADYDTGDETLNAVYGSETGFSAALTYVLSGGLTGSRQSDLQETISFTNKTSQTVHMQFYQYVDFDLNGTPGNDTVQVLNANTVRQSDGTVQISKIKSVLPEPATLGLMGLGLLIAAAARRRMR